MFGIRNASDATTVGEIRRITECEGREEKRKEEGEDGVEGEAGYIEGSSTWLRFAAARTDNS